MGFLTWLKGLFTRKKGADTTTPAAAPVATKTDTPAPKAGAQSNGSTAKAAPKAVAVSDDGAKDLNPQCAALTAKGDQCKRSARDNSKYCANHKGYRPPTAAKANGAKDTLPAVTGAKDTAPSVRGNTTAKPTGNNPQCAALTAKGDQCKRSARDSSKYCANHKGYRPPAAAKAAKAKDTKPVNKNARDTAPATRRAHVTHNGYKLYKKGARYYFSKKSQSDAKADGAEPVYEMPADRAVTVTPNGLPVLKKA